MSHTRTAVLIRPCGLYAKMPKVRSPFYSDSDVASATLVLCSYISCRVRPIRFYSQHPSRDGDTIKRPQNDTTLPADQAAALAPTERSPPFPGGHAEHSPLPTGISGQASASFILRTITLISDTCVPSLDFMPHASSVEVISEGAHKP